MVKIFKEENSDIICSMIGPYYKYGPPVVEAAIEVGVPYIDVNDDYEPTLVILDNLDKKAKDAGVTVLTGGELSPGWTNMMSKLGSTKLVSPDGEFEGNVYYVGHGEPATVPRYIDGVNEVINKGGLLPTEATDLYFNFIKAGLNDINPIEIDGKKVSLTDVTIALMERALKDSKIAENENCYVKVTVNGIKNNENKEVIYEIIEPGTHMTSWTASILAQMIANEEIVFAGTNTPEVLGVEQIETVIKRLDERGLKTKRSE